MRVTPGPFSSPVARAVLKTQTDDRLVALARRGSEAAFTEIVRRYRQPLVAFAAAYAPGDQAEDVVQESLERSWAAMQASDREIALKPWLYTIVRNRALNARRDARVHEPLEENIDGVPQPSDIVLEREELASVVAAVAALAPAERQALVDSALEGRTHDQIAAELETTSGAVRGMIYRGRMAVRGAVGAILPLPLVVTLLGGAGATGGATAAAGGASVAAKGAAVAALGAVALTSGVAVDRALRDEPNDRVAIVQSKPSDGGGDADASGGQGQRDGSQGRSSGPGGHSGPAGGDDDRSNEGHGGDGAEDESERREASPGHGPGEAEGRDDHSGPGHGVSDDDGGPDNSGPGSANSGPGSGSSGSGSGSSGSGSSGSGSSGSGSSGSSGSGSSGHGGGDDPPEPPEVEEEDD